MNCDLEEALRVPPYLTRERWDRRIGALLGARCGHCSKSSWPGRAVCFNCGSADMRTEAFAVRGQLITYTRVHVARPGLNVPYVLGQVKLEDDGPTVFGHVKGAIDSEAPMPKVSVRLSDDPLGGPPAYWFEPEGS